MKMKKIFSLLVITVMLVGCKEITDDTLIVSKLFASKESNNEIDMNRIREFAVEAEKYCLDKQIESKFFILVDLARHSGLKRFLV